MTFFDGLYFFIVLFLGCVPAIVLGLREKPIEKYLMFFSIIMILLIYTQNIKELLWLAAFVVLEWHVIMAFQYLRRTHGKNNKLLYHAVFWALLPLVLAKCSGITGIHAFSFVGISYITFRVVQIILETHDGLIQESGFWKTMNFLLFFPSLSSGPIDRSRRFEADLVASRTRLEYVDLLQKGLRKILLGIVYKFVLSAIFYDQLQLVAGRYTPQHALIYAYLYGIYMFFDFAGYSLMAVGTGYIFGIRLPDNFNKPFISIDMKDFWDRWHISLSHWFRDFVFSRFMMFVIRGKKIKNRMNAATVGFIVNMLIMGVWHGLSFDYLLYGLYHGILLGLTERWQKKKWYKKHCDKRWYKILSWAVTMNLVMFGFLIFSGYFMDAVRVIGAKM